MTKLDTANATSSRDRYCSECLTFIPKGTTLVRMNYETKSKSSYRKGLSNVFQTYYVCIDCFSIIKRLSEDANNNFPMNLEAPALLHQWYSNVKQFRIVGSNKEYYKEAVKFLDLFNQRLIEIHNTGKIQEVAETIATKR